MIECLGCKAEIVVPNDRLVVGAFLVCTECGTECRVTGLGPVRLALSDPEGDEAPAKLGK